jgi:hypothetical protein
MSLELNTAALQELGDFRVLGPLAKDGGLKDPFRYRRFAGDRTLPRSTMANPPAAFSRTRWAFIFSPTRRHLPSAKRLQERAEPYRR